MASIWLVLTLLAINLSVPEPIIGWHTVGDPQSTEAMKLVDQLAVKHGLSVQYHREVRWIRGVRSAGIESHEHTGDFAVVNYVRIGSEPELATGIQIWIDRKSKSAIVVTNKLVRAAHGKALNAGHDLTQYTWIVEESMGRFHFTFWMKAVRDKEGVNGGAFTVVVDGKSGRQVGPIIYQE